LAGRANATLKRLESLQAVPPAYRAFNCDFPGVSRCRFGLALVANGPAKAGLITVDTVTGNTTVVGPPHSELAGTGDLGTVDTKHNLYYYLGDTYQGATVVGLNLADGTKACSASQMQLRT
jgi:hypothetical protein